MYCTVPTVAWVCVLYAIACYPPQSRARGPTGQLAGRESPLITVPVRPCLDSGRAGLSYVYIILGGVFFVVLCG